MSNHTPNQPRDAEPNGPNAHIGAYHTINDGTVIYDIHDQDAWVSSTCAVLLSDVE
ncbi:DUF7331 family protein [Natronorubrum bangense]|uniref:DUF7331 family protein n=1 Tax=Natronorubrum bangense TaxID=61858 RepID=UPI000A703CD9|nr:hypothetical protein [Natronorubrum bangense]